MTDESQNLGEAASVPEEARPEVIAYKERVAKADGSLIPLKKTTSDGKQLYIAVQVLPNPYSNIVSISAPSDMNQFPINNPEFRAGDIENSNIVAFKKPVATQAPEEKVPNPQVNFEFYLWHDREIPKTGVVLIDTYVEAEENGHQRIVPLGHMDWFLEKDYANGGGNMHDARIPQSDHEKLAKTQWRNNPLGFVMKEGFQKQGVGSLMLATSAVALEAVGVTRFNSGVLREPAERTYDRFGIKPSDFPVRRNDWLTAGDNVHLPLQRLTNHPQVNKTIASFV